MGNKTLISSHRRSLFIQHLHASVDDASGLVMDGATRAASAYRVLSSVSTITVITNCEGFQLRRSSADGQLTEWVYRRRSTRYIPKRCLLKIPLAVF